MMYVMIAVSQYTANHILSSGPLRSVPSKRPGATKIDVPFPAGGGGFDGLAVIVMFGLASALLRPLSSRASSAPSLNNARIAPRNPLLGRLPFARRRLHSVGILLAEALAAKAPRDRLDEKEIEGVFERVETLDLELVGVLDALGVRVADAPKVLDDVGVIVAELDSDMVDDREGDVVKEAVLDMVPFHGRPENVSFAGGAHTRDPYASAMSMGKNKVPKNPRYHEMKTIASAYVGTVFDA